MSAVMQGPISQVSAWIKKKYLGDEQKGYQCLLIIRMTKWSQGLLEGLLLTPADLPTGMCLKPV
jgi:hypothetical protein